jgi:hypothetical protein
MIIPSTTTLTARAIGDMVVRLCRGLPVAETEIATCGGILLSIAVRAYADRRQPAMWREVFFLLPDADQDFFFRTATTHFPGPEWDGLRANAVRNLPRDGRRELLERAFRGLSRRARRDLLAAACMAATAPEEVTPS